MCPTSNKLAFASKSAFPEVVLVDCRFTPTKQLIIANRAKIKCMFLSFKNQNNS